MSRIEHRGPDHRPARSALPGVLVAVVVLVAVSSGCGGDESDASSTATTAPSSTTTSDAADTSGSTTVPPFEGLPADELPEGVDPAFLDALQRCYTAEVVGDEVFTFEGDPGDVAQLTPELRPGFLALRDCLVDRAADATCVDRIEPLDASQSDDEFAAVLASFGECATDQLS